MLFSKTPLPMAASDGLISGILGREPLSGASNFGQGIASIPAQVEALRTRRRPILKAS